MKTFCVSDYRAGDEGTYQTKCKGEIGDEPSRVREERVDTDGPHWAMMWPLLEELLRIATMLDCDICEHRFQCLVDPDAHVTYRAREGQQ